MKHNQRKLSKPNYFLIKRSMDLCLSLCGLFILVPLFLVVAVFIKIDNPQGPVFFRQIRVGHFAKPFTIYKFRTMVPNAEAQLPTLLPLNEISGCLFKIKKDPRITKIGGLLRKFSIDELPQLFNVLKGEMSLVGPRPPLPREVVMYNSYQRLRLLAKPGCTGLWQVSGRNLLSFEEMVKLDLTYLSHQNLSLDCQLLVRTVGAIIVPRGAF